MKTKCQEVFDLIEQEIRDGTYDKTRKLLSEDEYVTRYAVSRVTVRSAIDLLITRGYCYPIQGKGVFLRRHKIIGSANLEYIRGLTADLYPRKVTSKILILTQVPADERISKIMNCPLGTLLTHYERIRYADNEPVCFESLYFISSKVLISQEVLEGSVYEYLRSKLGVNILMIDHMITAIKLNENEAEYLGLQVGDPGLCFENLGMDRKGDIIQFGRTVSHYQRIRNLKMVSHL